MAATRPCEICGVAIPEGRLEAVPETRLCVQHARAMDAYGGEFRTYATQTSLGKGGSLKKNYGDVSVARKRNLDGLRRLREAYEQGEHR